MVEGNILIEKKAKYGLTVGKEFQDNFEPLNGENVEISYKALDNSVLAISNYRIVFLSHRKFSSDMLFCIPFEIIKKVSVKSSFLSYDRIIIGYEDKEIEFTPISESTGLGVSATAGALAASSGLGFVILKKRSKEIMLHMMAVLKPKLKLDIIEENSLPK